MSPDAQNAPGVGRSDTEALPGGLGFLSVPQLVERLDLADLRSTLADLRGAITEVDGVQVRPRRPRARRGHRRRHPRAQPVRLPLVSPSRSSGDHRVRGAATHRPARRARRGRSLGADVVIADDLNRRRLESWRCEPLEDGTGRRDPMDPQLLRRLNNCPAGGTTNRRRFVSPCTFGMDRVTLRAEARRCWDSGWQRWEILVRFDIEAAA
jgi:hypothetical protein